MVDLHALRNPKVIKGAVIGTAVIAVSLGVGLTISGQKNKNASSVQSDGGGTKPTGKESFVDSEPKLEENFLHTGEIPDHLDTVAEADPRIGGIYGAASGEYLEYGENRGADGKGKCIGGWSSSSGSSSSGKSGKVRNYIFNECFFIIVGHCVL